MALLFTSPIQPQFHTHPKSSYLTHPQYARMQMPLWRAFGYTSAEEMKVTAERYMSRLAAGQALSSMLPHILQLGRPIDESLRRLQHSSQESSDPSSASEGAGKDGPPVDCAVSAMHPAPRASVGAPVSKRARIDASAPTADAAKATRWNVPVPDRLRCLSAHGTPCDPSSPGR